LRKVLVLAALLCMAGLLAAGNLWFAARRSTIPLQLDDLVIGRETKHEKHPGSDDVYLLDLERRGTLQVDKHIYDAVHHGDKLNKAAWERQLIVGERAVALTYSEDFVGLTRVMPASLLVLIATACCVGISKHPASKLVQA